MAEGLEHELPEELIFRILFSLPVIALVRFKSVSKRWRNLIDSPYFIKSHLNSNHLSSNNNNRGKVVIFTEKPHGLYYIEFDSVCKAAASSIMLKQLAKPWSGTPCNFFGAVGVCNGLLCTRTIDSGIFLINPLTGNYSQVPQPKKHLDYFRVVWSWGFGYDSNADDYKVVGIASSRLSKDEFARFFVWVYSLKSGSWKCIGHLPYSLLGYPDRHALPYYLLSFRQKGVFVNGAMHWRLLPHTMARVEPDGSIVHSRPEWNDTDLIFALHLGKLKYSLVPKPPDYGYEDTPGRRGSCLDVLGGCLCWLVSFDYFTNGFDLWVMKEYGVKGSWTRLVTCTGYICCLTPLAYDEDGDGLLFVTNSNVMVRYDFQRGSFKKLVDNRLPHLGRPLVYQPSLIRPQAGNS